MREQYSLDKHVNLLTNMIEKSHRLGGCPATPDFHENGSVATLWLSSMEDVCGLCLKFVDIDPKLYETTCPCIFLGRTAAVKRTIQKLKEYKETGGITCQNTL